MKFAVIIQSRANNFIAGLDDDEFAELRRMIDALRIDPWIDNVTKFPYAAPPLMFCLYQNGPFSIVYRIKNNEVVDILNISLGTYVPPISEWDKWRRN